VLEVSFRHHPVTAARRVPTKLEIFFKQLLGRSPNAEIGPAAVEHVVAIERDTATAAATAMVP
jgi:hypothetical protein